MRRMLTRVLIGLALAGCGWVAGSAQGATPDFELKISGNAGTDIAVQCVRGCWVMTTGNRSADRTLARQGRDVGGACSDKAPCSIPVVGWTK